MNSFIEVVDRLVSQKQEYYELYPDEEANTTDAQRYPLREYHARRRRRKRKDNARAERLIKSGYRHMIRGAYIIAHRIYTSALCTAVPNSDLVPHCLHHRAMILYQLDLLDECITDVGYAMNMPITEDLKDKLICIKNQASFRKERKEYTRLRRISDADSEAYEIVKLSYGENPRIPGMSAALTVSSSEGMFKIVAVKPIKMGDVLLVQSPYSVVLQRQKKYRFCHYCLKPCWNLLPCNHCENALYCNKECDEKAAEEYHKFECLFNKEDTKIAGPLRFFLIATGRSYRLYQKLQDLQEDFNNEHLIEHGYHDSVYSPDPIISLLRTVPFLSREPESTMKTTANAILKTLKSYSNCLDGYDLDDVLEFLHVLVQAYTASTAIIRDRNVADALAQAVYPIYSILRHSCYSNTLWYTANYKDRVLLASRDITPGEVITNNYIGNRIFQDSAERINYLKTVKRCNCTCIICVQGYTLKRELGKIEVPASLQHQIRENPIDLESMWDVLEVLNVQANGRPCLEVAVMRFCIMDAYLRFRHPLLDDLYEDLGII